MEPTMNPTFRFRIALLAGAVNASASPAAAQFVDRTEAAGLTQFGASWGAAFVDLDGDGHLDLYSGHHLDDPTLFWNDGTGVLDRFRHVQPWSGPRDRHGALLLSLDDDLDPEIFVTHGAEGGFGAEPNELYRNDGAAGFYEMAATAGVDDPLARARTAAAADFDGDLRPDVWVGKALQEASPNSLFRNEGALAFTDMAAVAGLDELVGTVGGIWGDVDDDGDPDLLVGGEEAPRSTKLFRNDGGVFADASSIFLPPLPVVSGADWGDVDGDGDLDLVVCDGHYGIFDAFVEEGDSVSFFFNDRYGEDGVDGLTIPSAADTLRADLRVLGSVQPDLVFLGPDGIHPPAPLPILLTDEYVGAPTFTPGVDRGIWVYRTAPGGSWELRCSTPSSSVDNFNGSFSDGSPIAGSLAHDLEDPHFDPGGPRVWRNDGVSFVEITAALGLPTMLNPRDVSWVDHDNDGDLDIHVVDMGTSASPNAPDALFRNDGASFTDVTDLEGVAASSAGMGDGATWGDVDRDGDLDLYVPEGAGPRAFSDGAGVLFLENAAPRGHAILVDLVGTDSGTLAVGSRVTAHVGGKVVHRRVSANAWRGFSDPLRVHLGLGDAAWADSLIVEWPAGTVESYTTVVPGTYRLNEHRDVASLSILPATPDSVAPGQIEPLHFEIRSSLASRASGEAPNFRLESRTGLLAPQGTAAENPDSTYTFSFLSALEAGLDTLVVTDLLSDPPLADSIEIRIVTPTGAPDVHPTPLFALDRPHPNPFTGSCRLEYGLSRAGRATLAVFDVRGRRVRLLRSGPAAPGRHAATWDGVDTAGHAVPPGLYFVRLEFGGESSVRKLVLIR
jgi:hypothetical protein